MHPTTLAVLANQHHRELIHEAETERLASLARAFQGAGTAGGPRFGGVTLDVLIVALLIIGVLALVVH